MYKINRLHFSVRVSCIDTLVKPERVKTKKSQDLPSAVFVIFCFSHALGSYVFYFVSFMHQRI